MEGRRRDMFSFVCFFCIMFVIFIFVFFFCVSWFHSNSILSISTPTHGTFIEFYSYFFSFSQSLQPQKKTRVQHYLLLFHHHIVIFQFSEMKLSVFRWNRRNGDANDLQTFKNKQNCFNHKSTIPSQTLIYRIA